MKIGLFILFYFLLLLKLSNHIIISLSIEQFLENEDVTHLYILSQSSSHLLALNSIPIDFNSYKRIVLFIKTNLTNKLTRENLGLYFLALKTK